MRFNEKEAAEVLAGEIVLEDRLNYKKHNSGSYGQPGFKERWFKLKSNLLFYFRINELGKIDSKQPAGLFVLENYSIQPEENSGIPFAFSIIFRDEPDKKHIFAGRTDAHVQKWVTVLKEASYEYWRHQLIILQEKILNKTGKDPLLLYPHNQGFVRNFEEHKISEKVGQRESSFQSHILASSTAAISYHTAPLAALPLARSASSTSAVMRPAPAVPPRSNALARSASSSHANVSLSPPPRTSKSQFHRPISPLAQTNVSASAVSQSAPINTNGKCIDDSPNLIEL